MLPDLESLRCFDAAASHPSFRAAASAVGLSPAAFGERIHRLEETVGAKLFARTTRRVALTPEGRRVLATARRCLEEARACLAVGREGGAPAPFALTIATRFELGLSWLLPSLEPLRTARPERTLHLSFGSGPEVLRLVQRGEADAAVTSARISLTGIRYTLLHEEHYALVAAPSLVRRRPLRRPEDAAGFTLLDISADLPLFRYLVDVLPRREPWTFERYELLGAGEAIRRRVIDGAGIAVLPLHMVRADLREKRLVRLLPRVRLASDWFRFIWRADHPAQDELRGLAEELARRPLR